MVSRSFRYGFMVGLAGFVLALALQFSGAFLALERATWRWRVDHFASGPVGPDPIILIALDQQSLDWGARENDLSWPWPREAYGLILDFCRRGEAQSVGFDLLFSESSLYGVADDLALAEALQRVAVTVGSASVGSGPEAEWPDTTSRQLAGIGNSLPIVSSARASLPVSELMQSFDALGNVSATPDSDGVFRTASLLTSLDGQPVPAFSLAIYLASHPDAELRDFAGGYMLSGRQIPVDTAGRSVLRYRGPSGTFPTLSAAAIIQSELLLQEGLQPLIDPKRLRGAHVLFGLTAPGLFDLRPSPLDGVYPGMEIHATQLDNIQAGDFLAAVPVFVAALWALGLSLSSGLMICRCRNVVQAGGAGLLLLPLPVIAGFVAYGAGSALPVAFPGGATLLAFFGGILVNYATEGKKKREIRRAFNQYLHPTVIGQLVENPDRLRLGGEKREISIFFSDLEGFTSISESLDPEALTALLNAYLTEMTDIILGTGGTIDKYEGDAIIAFWNAPIDQPDHATRAVRAALACQERLVELRPRFRQQFGHDLSMRIGINTGLAVVGNMGSTRRFDYTMLGDAVNLAARLEGVNKVFATQTLISAATAQQIDPSLAMRKVATVAVVGRKEPVTIFAPLSRRVDNASFDRALDCYQQGAFGEAGALFSSLATKDPTAAVYERRCRELEQNPPDGWDGVWSLEVK